MQKENNLSSFKDTSLYNTYIEIHTPIYTTIKEFLYEALRIIDAYISTDCNYNHDIMFELDELKSKLNIQLDYHSLGALDFTVNIISKINSNTQKALKGIGHSEDKYIYESKEELIKINSSLNHEFLIGIRQYVNTIND
ncbi:hypothetical protein [Photobacterium leiognathi]|uniref:hypothetical protein n=1 Tax=Photobacterium leiognathi TaxID=553611 RepID=UPI002980BF77|nr:hypothetical protein [Photobacterium leiognathi]